jgi:nicotinamide mononucleotide transporter
MVNIVIEWTSVIAALIYVYFASKALRICFLFGLISSVGFVYICFAERLYFDTAINLYYIVMSFVGWFAWTGGRQNDFDARQMSAGIFLLVLSMAFLCALGLGFITSRYTDAQLSYIDAFTTVTAVIATWMMVRKFIENWMLWIIADGVSVFMYAYKDHWPIAGLFLIYTVISFYGYFNWKALIRRT